MLKLLVSVFALFLAASPAGAADCAVRDAIIGLSDTVLAKRTGLPPLQARNFGAESAYLKLRYEPEFGRQALDVIDALIADKVHNARDLGFAYHLDTFESPGMTANWLGGDAAFADAAIASATTVRAMLLNVGSAQLIEMVHKLPEDQRVIMVQPIYTALLDRPDEEKLWIVGDALSTGQRDLMQAMLATMRDATAWTDYAGGAPAEEVANATRRWRWLPTLIGNPPLSLPPGSGDAATRAKLDEIAAVAAIEPQLDFLNTYFNMTGEVDETLLAARALRDAIAHGEIVQRGTFDASWLFAYQALREIIVNEEALDRTLRAFATGKRPQRPTTADVLDWIIVTDKLAPYVTGKADDPPGGPPHGPGGTIERDWADWMVLAELVRSRPPQLDAGGDERSLAMTAELLFAARQYDALVALLGKVEPSLTGVGLAADFAQRLDRQCESYLWHPAEAIVLAGTPIFKFDDPPAESVPPDTFMPLPPAQAPADKQLKN